MQSIYCTECGSKNVYSGSKPKFCSSCGHPINNSIAPKKGIKKNFSSKLQEDETDIDSVPNLNSLAYEITDDGSLGCQSMKFEEIFNAQEKARRQKR